jgi:alanine dehydrogenase
LTQTAIYLSAEDCERLLQPRDVLDAIERVMNLEARGEVRWPVPRNLNIVPDVFGNDYHLKACVLEGTPVAGIRLVSHPKDESSPECTRLVLLIDPRTTLLAAVVDERWNYSQRTVAAVAVATRQLAVPGARRLAIVGAGRLARSALTYYTQLFDLEEIVVASRRPETRAALAADARDRYGIAARAADSIEEAVRGAELVLTCTSAEQPLLQPEWIAPGSTVTCLETTEPGGGLVQAADLFVVDSREQLERELVALYGSEAPVRISATFADIVASRHPGRTDPGQRVLIVTDGLASQDVALAHQAYLRARDRGMGAPLPFGQSI